MKFVVAQMMHETHTFIPQTTPLAAFNLSGGSEPPTGETAAGACRGTNSAVAAFIDIIEEAGEEYVTPVIGQAWPSGPVQDEAYEWMCEKITNAVREGCDAVLLDLHGSMAAESYADGEGELLRRIREISPDIPIAVALDFHCVLTDRMMDNATVITAYRTIPHVDMYETGQRAARTLLSMLRQETRPVTGAWRIPLMASLEKMGPQEPPMKDIMDLIRELEEQGGGILNASLAGGHPFTDVFPNGMVAIIVADGDRKIAQHAAEKVLKLAWEKREGFVLKVEPYIETLKKALELSEGPVIMADSGDIAASGGFAADMTVLEEAINLGFEDLVAGPIHDPQSIRRMEKAGVGSEVTLDIGGKTSAPLLNYEGKPLRLSGRVRAIVDGRFKATGPMLRGLTLSIGLMGVLSVGSIDILITEQRVEALDAAIFTHAGLDVRERKYVLLKSRMHFQAAFEPIARHIVRISGPGVTSPDFSEFPFRHVDRPIFPLERDAEYRLVRIGSVE